MTIKEAFGMLFKAVKKSGLNPFFLINNLKDTFEDVAANVVDGADVEVESAQSSGYLVGNIKVNGEDNYLFAPPQIIPPHIYDSNERLAAVWYHDNIAEDIYEKTISVSNITLTQNQQTEIYSNSNIRLFNAYGYLIESGIRYMIPESGVRIKQDSLAIYLMATGASWSNCDGVVVIQYSKVSS